jgi:hypothetical protein
VTPFRTEAALRTGASLHGPTAVDYGPCAPLTIVLISDCPRHQLERRGGLTVDDRPIYSLSLT